MPVETRNHLYKSFMDFLDKLYVGSFRIECQPEEVCVKGMVRLITKAIKSKQICEFCFIAVFTIVLATSLHAQSTNTVLAISGPADTQAMQARIDQLESEVTELKAMMRELQSASKPKRTSKQRQSPRRHPHLSSKAWCRRFRTKTGRTSTSCEIQL